MLTPEGLFVLLTASGDPILTGPQDGTGRDVVFDIESNGLFFPTKIAGKDVPKSTRVWCIGAIDIATGQEFYWGVDQGEDSLGHALAFLAQCTRTVAHNGVGYDYPDLEHHYPGWQRPERAYDSLPICKVVWPAETLIGRDMELIRRGKMPPKLMKSHSLKAWGIRTGTHKTEYTGGFEAWNPQMAEYMMDDNRSLLVLWRLIRKRIGWDDPKEGEPVWDEELTIRTECEVTRHIFEQTNDGVHFDLDAAEALAAELRNELAAIEKRLKEVFGTWWQPLDDPEQGVEIGSTQNRALPQFPDVTLRRVSEKTGKDLKPYVGPPLEELVKGDRHVRIEWTTFNPASRDHLGMRLQAVYGWKPKAFGKNGKPTVDEGTLEEIPDAVMPADIRQLLLDYFVVAKTLGTLAKGQAAWIGRCTPERRIHGRMDPQGTPTRRGTHSSPNLSGTPSVKKEKVVQPDGSKIEQVLRGLAGRYGWECRALFIADTGWELTGVDASSLELIDLGHYLFPLDGGAFSARVCDPTRDAHSEHAELAGTTRADAKTTIYLFVYGGSAWKLSLDRGIIVLEEMVPTLLGYRGLPMLLKALERRFDADFVAKLDDMQKARLAHSRQIIIKLEAGIAGLKDLKTNVTKAAERGWLKAIDGSRIIVRKPHAALNALLQSAGAISCKRWMCLVHRELKARGLVKGVDYKQVLWVHDELQFTHRPGLGPLIREVAETCLVRAGEELGLRGRYRTEGKTGRNWAECH